MKPLVNTWLLHRGYAGQYYCTALICSLNWLNNNYRFQSHKALCTLGSWHQLVGSLQRKAAFLVQMLIPTNWHEWIYLGGQTLFTELDCHCIASNWKNTFNFREELGVDLPGPGQYATGIFFMAPHIVDKIQEEFTKLAEKNNLKVKKVKFSSTLHSSLSCIDTSTVLI